MAKPKKPRIARPPKPKPAQKAAIKAAEAKKPCGGEGKAAQEANVKRTGSGAWPGSLRGWGPITRGID